MTTQRSAGSEDDADVRHGVLQLRLVVEAEDFESALHFYRDVLGLREQAAFEADGDARVSILELSLIHISEPTRPY